MTAHPTSTASGPASRPTSDPAIKNHGWRVTFAGLGINLALGILYSWSVIKEGVPKDWSWTQEQKSWPYAAACLVFAVVMVPAGLMQDRIGPRLTASLGGLLVGMGLILASFVTTPLGYILGFGVLAGAGFGFGYASATPPAVKWFPSSRTGLIAGIVVAGFGLAGVYAAPLTQWLIDLYGLQRALQILGGAFLIVVVLLAQLLTPPPPGFVPAGAASSQKAQPGKRDFQPWALFGTWQFYLLWFIYFCGAGAGLMIISTLTKIAGSQAGLTKAAATSLVAVLAIGNGFGRVAAGALSDRIGRKATLCLCLLIQAGVFLILSRATTGSPLAAYAVVAALSALIGANYGANLSLFPSVTKDYYGLKNFGVNYGLVFTAWGAGSLLAPMAGKIHDASASYERAYYIAAGLLIVAAVAALGLQAPRSNQAGQ